jgi:hypothetical protein
MDIEELHKQWVGKRVRTERVVNEEEFAEWEGPFGTEWYPGYKFGGVGTVIDFKSRNGTIWLEADDGCSWVVDDQTVITLEGGK